MEKDENSENENTEVIATRMARLVSGTVCAVILTIVVIPVGILGFFIETDWYMRFMFVLIPIVFIAVTISMIRSLRVLPKVMIEYKDGKFRFYPKKDKEIVLLPEEVEDISRKHEGGGRFNQHARPSGRLTVTYKGGTIVLDCVADLEYSEKRIEKIIQERRVELLRAELAEKGKTKE